MSTLTTTRKRSRAQHLEPDELSPEKATKTALSSKRRRLNTDRKSSNLLTAAVGKVSGFLGFGKGGKENKEGDGDDDMDELADEDEDELVEGSMNGKGGKEKDIFSVPSSSPEVQRGGRRNGLEQSRLGRGTKSPATPKVKAASAAKKVKASAEKEREKSKTDIWDVPDDEDQPTPRRTVRKLTSAAEKAKALLRPVVTEDESPKRSTGTSGSGRGPRKSDLLKKAKKIGRQDARERIAAAEEEIAETEEEEEVVATPKRGRKAKASADTVPGSARPRGRPRKEVIEEERVPKGILTPSKGRTPKPKRSVVWNDNVDEEEHLGFKDIDPKSTKKSRKSIDEVDEVDVEAAEPEIAETVTHVSDSQEVDEAGDVEADSKEDDVDEEICAICSGAKSIKRNQIVFCDGCDFIVHQDCYGLTVIPEGDWYCKNCRPTIEDDGALQLVAADLPDIEGFANNLRQMQHVLLSRLTGRKRIKLRGHDEEMQKVHQIVEQTVLAGEGNSILVIGARGCGKTTLVESVISEVSNDHRENFHVVRLNGFIHTDDKLALKEIWRQLGREMEVEDDPANKTSNYADTLASLLALLSHPSDFSEERPDQTAKSVIFVLDEFDLFTTHPRQTLLYNLFDIAQAKKAPIAVLGLTTRIDVMDSLEKRVKSRFSHRYVHLTLPRSLPAYWEICKQGLMVDSDDLEAEGLDSNVPGQDAFISYWDSMIEDLYTKDITFKSHLQSQFYKSKSVPEFFSSCILPISTLSTKQFKLIGTSFSSPLLSLSPPDSKLLNLQGLSELELALLVSAARLDIILDTDTCNFAMVYDEYSTLTSRHKIQTSSSGVTAIGSSAKVWGRDVAVGAWERLAEYDLLVPAVMGTSVRDTGVSGRMWRVDVGLEEIKGSVEGISSVMAKWCREI